MVLPSSPRATSLTYTFHLFRVETHMDRAFVQTTSIIQAQADAVVSHVAPKWCFLSNSCDVLPVHTSWLGPNDAAGPAYYHFRDSAQAKPWQKMWWVYLPLNDKTSCPGNQKKNLCNKNEIQSNMAEPAQSISSSNCWSAKIKLANGDQQKRCLQEWCFKRLRDWVACQRANVMNAASVCARTCKMHILYVAVCFRETPSPAPFDAPG